MDVYSYFRLDGEISSGKMIIISPVEVILFSHFHAHPVIWLLIFFKHKKWLLITQFFSYLIHVLWPLFSQQSFHGLKYDSFSLFSEFFLFIAKFWTVTKISILSRSEMKLLGKGLYKEKVSVWLIKWDAADLQNKFWLVTIDFQYLHCGCLQDNVDFRILQRRKYAEILFDEENVQSSWRVFKCRLRR